MFWHWSPSLLRIFIRGGYWSSSHAFSALNGLIPWFFFFTRLIWWQGSGFHGISSWIWIDHIFLRTFASVITQDISPSFLFLYYLHLVLLGPYNEVGGISFSFIFWKRLCSVGGVCFLTYHKHFSVASNFKINF